MKYLLLLIVDESVTTTKLAALSAPVARASVKLRGTKDAAVQLQPHTRY